MIIACVLRTIDNLHCSDDFRQRNFALCYEINDLQNGKQNRYFNITKDGATFLIMGFTGEKAIAVKVDLGVVGVRPYSRRRQNDKALSAPF